MSALEEPATDKGDLVWSKLTATDFTVFGLLLVGYIGIGIYSGIKGRGNASTQEYLLGGRKMSVIPVAFSMVGGILSAITILGYSTEVYFFGTQLCTYLLGIIPGCVLAYQVILPIFYNLKLVSMMEYVELRYKSPALRKLMTVSQVVAICMYMGICQYAPSMALSTFVKLPAWVSILITGIVSTFYTTIGGVKAVVYTDVLQTLVMFGGVLLVVVICVVDLGGVGHIWEIADQGDRIEFFNMDTNPFVRHTFWTTMVYGIFFGIFWVGLKPESYQRFALVSTHKVSKRLCVFFVVGMYLLSVLFFFSGLVAYATYSDCDPLTSGRMQKKDQLLPLLVLDKLSHLTGIAGMFLAAIYGGVLSSLSSSGNMTALLVWEDLLKDRYIFQGMSDEKATNVLKFISLVTGAIGICVALLVGNLGSIFYVNNIIALALLGPQNGVFLAGICTPWVNGKGAVAGLAVATVFNVWLVIGKFVRGGGSLPTLPLSTDGCPENLGPLANYSVAAFFENITVTDALLANDTSVHESASKTMYDISYCYSGSIGIILTLVISSLVSLCTGPLSPGDLDAGLTSPTCARFHQWLWGLFRGRSSVTISSSSQGDGVDNTAAFTVSPETDTDDGNTPCGYKPNNQGDGGGKQETFSMSRKMDTNTANQGDGTHQQMVSNTSPKMNTGDLNTSAL